MKDPYDFLTSRTLNVTYQKILRTNRTRIVKFKNIFNDHQDSKRGFKKFQGPTALQSELKKRTKRTRNVVLKIFVPAGFRLDATRGFKNICTNGPTGLQK